MRGFLFIILNVLLDKFGQIGRFGNFLGNFRMKSQPNDESNRPNKIQRKYLQEKRNKYLRISFHAKIYLSGFTGHC